MIWVWLRSVKVSLIPLFIIYSASFSQWGNICKMKLGPLLHSWCTFSTLELPIICFNLKLNCCSFPDVPYQLLNCNFNVFCHLYDLLPSHLGLRCRPVCCTIVLLLFYFSRLKLFFICTSASSVHFILVLYIFPNQLQPWLTFQIVTSVCKIDFGFPAPPEFHNAHL